MQAINIMGYYDELRIEVSSGVAKKLSKQGLRVKSYPRITHNLEEMKESELEYVVTYESHMIYWNDEIDIVYPQDLEAVNIVIGKPGFDNDMTYINEISYNMDGIDFPYTVIEYTSLEQTTDDIVNMIMRLRGDL